MRKLDENESLIESLLLACEEPLSIKKLSEITNLSPAAIKEYIDKLINEYIENERGIQIRQVAGGYSLYTHPAHFEKVSMILEGSRKRKLTQAALETLSIIAYKQPVTRASVSGIRGVNVDGVISSLLDKELIEEVGREDSPGQPILYGATKRFLESIGMNSIKDLPPLEQFEPDEKTKMQIARSLMPSGKAE